MEQLSLHKPALSLLELNSLIRKVLEGSFPDLCWVIAEIADAKCNQKGHCYMELVERLDNKTVAQARATVWAFEYKGLSRKFEAATGATFRPGMKVLLLVAIGFHEIYGLSMNVKDIDPAYTIGEMALRKKEILERLRKEGLIDRNKELPMPMVPQRIAVISSPTAAGFQDFANHLDNNEFGYKFSYTLFPAVMQGDETERSVSSALEQVAKVHNEFDIATIIRGGGSAADLSSFDSYEIAARIARLGIPVITGIGHEKDDTVADSVAHLKMKTPTAVADYIISSVRSFDEHISGIESSLRTIADDILSEAAQTLASISNRFRFAASVATRKPLSEIDRVQTGLKASIRQFFGLNDSRLAAMEQAARHLDPQNILRRGFSITRINGSAVRNSDDIPDGALVETVLHSGRISSRVEKRWRHDGKEQGA